MAAPGEEKGDEGAYIELLNMLQHFNIGKGAEKGWSRAELYVLQKMLGVKEYRDDRSFDIVRANISDAIYVKLWENPEWKTARLLNAAIHATVLTLTSDNDDVDNDEDGDLKLSSMFSPFVKKEPLSDSEQSDADSVGFSTPFGKQKEKPADDKTKIKKGGEFHKLQRAAADVTTGRGLRRLFARAVSGRESTRVRLPSGENAKLFLEPEEDQNYMDYMTWILSSKDDMLAPPVVLLRNNQGWTLDTRWNRSIFASLLYYFHDWLARATADTLGIITGKLPRGEDAVTLQEVLTADLDNFATFIHLKLTPVLKRKGAFEDVVIDREGTLLAVVRRIYHARYLRHTGNPRKQALYTLYTTR
jgi:hypothetical protein